uniref:Uncharacterized protein n=1 Tax=Timema monikensis TaxID=170555 RepID=A0A7R9EIC9_9NEOP|nr:unnamed protein product [Timema monikensis]
MSVNLKKDTKTRESSQPSLAWFRLEVKNDPEHRQILDSYLDMERALLDGEWSAQSEKLTQEEDRLSVLRARVSQLDQDMERSRTRDLHRQAECKKRLHGAEEQINRLEKEIDKCSDPDWQQGLTERLRHQFELFEAERKLFEDLEFGQLEEEADLLAGREELQREVTELSTRVQCRQLRLRELETQRTDTALAAQQEGREMERALIEYLRRLEEGRGRLRIIEARLEEMVGQSIISGQDSSPDDGEELSLLQRARQSSKQSQDDLDRISRVTSGAPMEVRMGSLGRKTLESLKEIERNRHLHLAQQGSQVIEEERKRVQELKQRVQDEVKAQWEERRQREANCTSFNSDESSLTSSDHPTEREDTESWFQNDIDDPGYQIMNEDETEVISKTDEMSDEDDGCGNIASKNERGPSNYCNGVVQKADRKLTNPTSSFKKVA